MPRISKDCFGTVIASLKKMKECIRCELLSECRAMNWRGQEEADSPPVIVRRSPKSGESSNSTPV